MTLIFRFEIERVLETPSIIIFYFWVTFIDFVHLNHFFCCCFKYIKSHYIMKALNLVYIYQYIKWSIFFRRNVSFCNRTIVYFELLLLIIVDFYFKKCPKNVKGEKNTKVFIGKLLIQNVFLGSTRLLKKYVDKWINIQWVILIVYMIFLGYLVFFKFWNIIEYMFWRLLHSCS